MSEQSDRIPCFAADWTRTGSIKVDIAISLVREGHGFITRTRTGRQRFVAFPYERTLHELNAGSRTTRPMRASGDMIRGRGQLMGSVRAVREHIPGIGDAYGFDEACNDPLWALCNERGGEKCICEEICREFCAGNPVVIEAITGRRTRPWVSQSTRTFGGFGGNNPVVRNAPARKGRMSSADARRATESDALRRRANLTPGEWAALTIEERQRTGPPER